MITLNRCIEVAGGDRVGRFLYRLHHWTNFTRIVRGGVKWVALTYNQWADELAVSYTQFKYLLEKAAAAGQVVREQHRFRGLKVLFVRLSDDTRVAIAQTGKGKSAQTGLGKSAQLIRNSNQKPIEVTKIASGPPAAAAPAPTPTQIKVPALEALWREARPSAPITKKMRGQFRHLVRTLRVGEAERVVRFALAHWPAIVRAAEKHHGAFKSPDVPQLGFLVKHIEAARGLMGEHSQHLRLPIQMGRWQRLTLSEGSNAADDPSARADAGTSPVDGGGWEVCADRRVMTYREMLALEGIAA
ncbi:hypothetical protein [Reyranella sp.]|uniref:hypothetical protein n=1 Tax=Reyranella sp. TaxID=1929291 RepID=UPI0012046A92|nr:hypothetical protein [Reyranella sp.]TAJ84554.1 MAG: hypothetical protein EPO50_17855 [Reyranella sp.]